MRPKGTVTPHPPKKTKGEGGGQTPPTATPAHPRAAGGPRKGRGTRGTPTNAHTREHLRKEWRGAAETRTPARTPTPRTRTGNGCVQAERARSHARPKTPTKNGGVQSETQNPTASTANPSREKRGKTRIGTQKHPPKTPARAGRVTETRTQARPRPKHKHHTTIGNPVSIARALRQPVPCR